MTACGRKRHEDPPRESKEHATGTPSGGATHEGAAPAKGEVPAPPPRRFDRSAPVGPDLPVYPGQGIGPLRFGAYAETIQRLLGAPCDYETPTRCVHFDRALDLTLEDGVLAKILIERPDHTPRGLDAAALGSNSGRVYGTFNGKIEPKIVFGLHKHIVEEEFGKPQREEKVDNQAPTGLVARAFYDHMVFEYDRIENGNVILSAIELTPNERSRQIMAKAALAKKKAHGAAAAP